MNCPSYDGIYDGQGPCWTCQGEPEHCPIGPKNLIREALKGMRNTPKRQLLHEMIVEISEGVDD